MSTDELTIAELLTQAQDGALVLPDFQRAFVWKLQDIRSFLASLCLDYPVGSFLTVEDSADLFGTRPLEGIDATPSLSAKGTLVYLLDGQQRLTSCHLIFSDCYKNPNVDPSIRRRWFLNLNALGLTSLTPLKDEELMEVFEDEGGALRAQKVDLRSPDRPEARDEDDPQFLDWCHKEGVCPLSVSVLKGNLNHSLLYGIADARKANIAGQRNISPGSKEYLELDRQKNEWVNWITRILNSLSKRTIPVLKIGPGATLEKVARVFETVNKTGITLSLFELFVARATSPNSPALRKVIEKAHKEFVEAFNKSLLGEEVPEWDPVGLLETPAVNRLFDAEFPKLVATLVQLESAETTLDLSKRTILRTPREAINRKAAQAAIQLFRAFAFLQLRCGVPWQISNSPYQAMILPIAAALGDDVWNSNALLNKLEAWYWAAIFSGRYKEAQDRKGRQDVFTVRDYITLNGGKPDVIVALASRFEEEQSFRDAQNSSDGLYRATLQYILSRRPWDLTPQPQRLLPGAPYTKEQNKTRRLEDHHIIPKSWLEKNKRNLPSFEAVDSCLNRAWVSFGANRGRTTGIFDQNPAQYLSKLSKEVLSSLFIPEELRAEVPDPLQLLLTERYARLKASVIERVSTLS